jgi:hypothetical protein
MEPISPQTVDEGQILTIPVIVSDPDFGETYIYSITLVDSDLMPEGIWLDTSGDFAEFKWETSYYQAGSYIFNFSVTDGTYTAYQWVTITVINVNGPPEILNPPQEPIPLTAGRMNKISLAVADPDSDPLTCSVQNIPAATCTVRKGQLEVKWKPGADDNGITYFTIGISDGMHTSTYQIPVRITSKILTQEPGSVLPAILPDVDSFMGILESVSHLFGTAYQFMVSENCVD